jgi:hypothetical protein
MAPANHASNPVNGRVPPFASVAVEEPVVLDGPVAISGAVVELEPLAVVAVGLLLAAGVVLVGVDCPVCVWVPESGSMYC